jgi:hypothetical protein
MRKGKPKGMMPADSNSVCNFKFVWLKAAGFCKNGGMSTHVNVVLDPLGGVRNHITRAKD